MKNVLFVCVHNAGRSQMAEAFFNRMVEGKAVGFSAGTQITETINPLVVEAMQEVGIDISREKPKMLTLDMMDRADKVITMGCGVDGICPASIVPSEDWKLEDPAGKPLETVRKIRDEVKLRVEKLIVEMDIKKE
jgi:arsenate reductase (thioredoxin)